MEMQGNVQLQGAMFSSDHDEDAFELKLIFNKTKYKYLCLDLWKQCQRKPSPESIKTKKKRKEIQNICQSLFSSTLIFLSSIIFSIILSGSAAFRSCEVKAVGHVVQKNTVPIIKYKMLYCPLTFVLLYSFTECGIMLLVAWFTLVIWMLEEFISLNVYQVPQNIRQQSS